MKILLIVMLAFSSLYACQMRPQNPVFGCDNGLSVEIEVPQNYANRLKILYDGAPYSLYRIQAASGEKYGTEQGITPEEGLIVWSKGNEMSLYTMILDDSVDANDYPLITQCHKQTL